MRGRVLVVDDDEAMGDLLIPVLRRRGFEPRWCPGALEALALLEDLDAEAVVTDLHMAGLGGIALCERIVARHPGLPVVVLTAFGSLETALSALRAGAYDFLTKPMDLDVLTAALDRAVQHHRLKGEVRRLRQAVRDSARFEELLGSSPSMRALYDLLERVAAADATALITGESGTGKEVVARAIHRRGRRRDGPFVAINCAALPEALLESELFGHVKGAFTDARESRSGLFVAASGGTLFLDEVGELPLALQPKLLRALQERRVRPLGGGKEIPFDARLVAATNRDLERAVEEGRFRADLFYRLHVLHVELPPLRERGGDILTLAQHFLGLIAARMDKPVRGLDAAAAQRLMEYGWPGNVRELENCMERAVALARGEQVAVDDLPARVQRRVEPSAAAEPELPVAIEALLPMDEVERRYIQKVLAAVGGNRSQAAKILGFDRKTLYRKLVQYRLEQAEEEG